MTRQEGEYIYRTSIQSTIQIHNLGNIEMFRLNLLNVERKIQVNIFPLIITLNWDNDIFQALSLELQQQVAYGTPLI